MTTFAILPVKRMTDAKQRLAETIPTGTKRALVEAMVTDVLIALRRSEHVNATLVVSNDTTAAALATGFDALDVIGDEHESGHTDAALLGIAAARQRGAERVVLLPGDVPSLDPAEIDLLLDRPLSPPEVIVVPDRHGSGTNGLVLCGPDVIVPAFGPGSRERHVALAAAAGASCDVIDLPSIGFDVDTADDLSDLSDRLAEVYGGASHTRGLLARIGRRQTPDE